MKTILFIPDMQHAPGHPTKHVHWVANLAADYEPDVVVQGGDWNDCSAISSWDEGTRAAWNKDHQKDCDHSRKALAILEEGLEYGPRKIALEGNHDGGERSSGSRLGRLVNRYPKFANSLECPMQCFRDNDWEVVPFMQPIIVEGVAFCHLFSVKSDGKKLMKNAGSTNALTQLSGVGQSCVAGHKQGMSWDNRPIRGKVQQAVIAGSCYLHDENYLTNQGNVYFRGVLLLHVYKKGQFDVEQWSLERLKKVYG